MTQHLVKACACVHATCSLKYQLQQYKHCRIGAGIYEHIGNCLADQVLDVAGVLADELENADEMASKCIQHT